MEITISNQSLSEGLKVNFDIETAPISLSYALTQPIRSTLAQAGKCSKTVIERRAGEGLLAFLPQVSGVTQIPAGHSTSLSIQVALPLFQELFSDLPDCLKKLEPLAGSAAPPEPFHYRSTIDWNSRFVIRQIVACPYRGDTRRVFLEAKALELIAYKLAEMGHTEKQETTGFSPRELDRVRQAHHILLHRLDHPPGLQDLCAMVGLNRNKLNSGFKKLYGGTAFQILRDTRLAKALVLLQETDTSLSQIALSVGYSDQANFSNAFRNHFGRSPKTVRRENGAFSPPPLTPAGCAQQ